MSRTLELGRFTVREGEEEAFLAKREAMVAAAKESFAGLIDVTLAKLDDGTYVDVALWESRDACRIALETAENVPAVADWLGHIDADVEMVFGRVVDRA